MNNPQHITRLALIAFLNGESNRSIARGSNLSEATVSRAMSSVERPSPTALSRIAQFFGMHRLAGERLLDRLDRVQVLAVVGQFPRVEQS